MGWELVDDKANNIIKDNFSVFIELALKGDYGWLEYVTGIQFLEVVCTGRKDVSCSHGDCH